MKNKGEKIKGKDERISGKEKRKFNRGKESEYKNRGTKRNENRGRRRCSKTI